MKGKNWLSGFLALALCANVMGTGAFAAEPAAPASGETQSVSPEETVYVNSYGGSDRSILFDENWKFNLGDASGAENAVYNDSAWRTVDLPHDYSIEQDYSASGEGESGFLPGGTGWYRKSFSLSQDWKDKRVSIDFGGVYMNAIVYLNGEQLGTHPYGYTPFSFVLPADKLRYDGENVIAVKVENKIPSSRWYSGSGIYRSVHLTVTNPVHVARYGTTVTTTNAGAVHIKTQVQNDGAASVEATLIHTVYPAGSNTAAATVTGTSATITEGAAQTFDADLSVSNPAIWSLDAPNMYFVRTEVRVGDQVVDTYDTDFGFREFAFNANTGFSLNGENMKLKGMCMHHDQGALGSEAWYRATERQVEILKDMGCNAIRVTHNPASDELIDICNEKGMLVIEEMFDGWHLPKNGNVNDYSVWFNRTIGADNAIIGGEAAMTWAQFDLQETIRRGRNAPAIIAWSLGNEVQEGAGSLDQTFVNNAKKLLDWGKAIDPTRPFTTGDNTRGGTTAYNSVVADAGGIVGYNYYTQPNSQDSFPSAHSAHPAWILYGAETASAVNSRGVYDRKGSQADKNGDRKLTSYDKSCVGWGATASKAWWYTIQNDFNAGEFVWTGFDYIGEPTPWNATGPGMNSDNAPKNSYFGVIDTNGLPKDSYYLYQSMWNDDVHTLHVLPTWDETDVMKDSGGKVEVVVYSDAPVVSLLLNGAEVGRAKAKTNRTGLYTYQTYEADPLENNTFVSKTGHESLYATFNVPYAAGTLTAKAYKADGTTEITGSEGRASVSTTSGASKLAAAADRSEITADGRDLSYITIDVTDNNGNIINGAEDEISVSVSGNGTLVGLDNGVQADHTSYQSNKRKAGAGRLVAIVQSTKEAGSFTLNAAANGLTGASASVTTAAAPVAHPSIVSCKYSKNYYVKVGVQPQLTPTAVVNYSDGHSETKNVTWNEIPADAIAQVGSFAVGGVIADTGTVISVNINMLDEVAALLNYSTAIPVGGTLTLPSSRPAVMADGTVLTAEFPVTWETPADSAFDSAGTVTVSGTATVFGKEIAVTASIRVAEGSIVPGGNVAAQAAGLGLNQITNKPDGLENVRDGDAGTAWTGTGDILFRYDTAQNLNKIGLTFQDSVPSGVSCAWSGDGNTFTTITAQPTADGLTTTYNLGGLVPAVWVKLSFASEAKLAEAALLTGMPSFDVGSSAALTGMTVNGHAVDAASLEVKDYPTQALVLQEVTAESGENASYTVLPAQAGVVKILTESEDHAARDVYQITLGAKTNGQPLSANNSSLDYDRAKTTASAGSQQPSGSPEGPADLAVDGSEETWWHSRWSAPADDLRERPEDRWFMLTLDEETTLSALRYKPRPTVANGIVTEYRVEVSTNGTDFTPVASGTWAHDTVWKLAQFDHAVQAKYVKLYGVETRGGAGDNPNQFMSAAEVRVRKAEALTAKDLSSAAVTVNKNYDWTGSPIVPAPEDVTVTLSGRTLTYGVDYTLRAENNTAAGTATLYVDGIVDYTGAASGTFTINTVDTHVTGFQPLEQVTTLNGVAPTLPTKATAIMNAGPNVEKDVTWDAVNSAQYTDPAAKTFSVQGTVAGTNIKPSVTVKVIKGTSADGGFTATTVTGAVPTLPAQATVHFDDDSTRRMDIVWTDNTSDRFASAGTVTVNGTVAVGKDSLPVTASVQVYDGTPTENLALNTTGSGFPMALAYVSAGNNNPYQALDGVNGTGAINRWSDWERNTFHTEPKAWLAVAPSGTSAPAEASQTAHVSLEKQLLNKAVIHFVDENGNTSGAVTFPADYEVQYYTGPDELTIDTRLSNTDQEWGNGRVRGLGAEHPLNKAENWTTVAYNGGKPAVLQSNAALTVEFQPVNTSLLRILCTPKSGKWTGVSGFEVYGLAAADKTALSNAITAANTAKTGVVTSELEASAVAEGVKFVTAAEMKALTDAITAAEAVKSNAAATQVEVDGAVSALTGATSTFTAAVKTGTKTLDQPHGNLARPSDDATVTASADEFEEGHGADKAIDGSRSSNSRWASNNNRNAHWLQLDLGKERTVSSVVLYWENMNATNYTIETSADGSTNWTAHAIRTAAPAGLRDVITLDSPVTTRYIRLKVNNYGAATGNWYCVSIFEFEVYGTPTEVPVDPTPALNALEVAVENGRLKWTGVPENMTLTFGANYEQVVSSDKTVYQPLVDTEVELDVTLRSGDMTASTAPASPKKLTIPGVHSANEGNAKPAVIPELAEWYSAAEQSGQTYRLNSNSRIVAGTALSDTAKELQADIKDLFGFTPQIVSEGAQAGDIVLTIGSGDAVAGFDDETYLMEITDKAVITATASTGAYWGTRSVLQALKLSGDAMTIPQGTARDYPEFRLRGFMLDVGRKPLSMDMLRQIGKNMAWYKLNDFHVHVSDNLIFMEDYSKDDPAAAHEAYSAFRLESGKEGLAAKDYHYTKDEFKSFVTDLRKIGVEVVPEIDVPAHAKALTDAFPDYRLNKAGTYGGTKRPWIDHFDLTGHYDESLGAVKGVFDEYIDGNVFDNIVHFGADEYYDDHSKFAPFVKDMIGYVQGKNRTARVWGSLSIMGNAENVITPEVTKGVQMDIWNIGWAKPQDMYDLGFDLINITDGPCYIVPSGSGNRGTYGDYLDLTAVYRWTPNNIGGTVLPASSSQVLGGSYALWQDNIDTRAAGIDETDTFNRFYDALAPFSVKMWGEGGDGLDRTLNEVQEHAKLTGYAPNTNPTGEVELKQGTSSYFRYNFADTKDTSGNGRDLTLSGANLDNGALNLSGGGSYAETPVENIGWDNKLTFRVKKTPGGPLEQVLFEGDHAYGEYDIKAIRASESAQAWKLGFSRELYDYVWDVELPESEWVKLTIETGDGTAKLYVGDSASPVSAIGSFKPDEHSNTQFKGKTGITHASFRLPTARIGSRTNAFIGLIDDVAALPASSGTPLDEGKYDIPTSGYQSVAAGSTQSDALAADKAIDGDATTIWHSSWNGCTPEEAWIQLELAEKTTVSGLRYLPRSTGGNNGIIQKFNVLVSDTGEDGSWTTVLENGSFAGMSGWQTASFPATETKFVRVLATESVSDSPSGARFVSAAELRVCRAPDLGEAAVDFAQDSYPLVNGEAVPEPTVTLDGKLLTLDTDYTLSYNDNTAAGTATVIVTGKGAYTGSKTAEFTVTEAEPPEISYTVTFASDGGTLVKSVTVQQDGRVTKPEDPVKDGYTFDGWFKEAELTTEWDFAVDTVTADITLYAKWTENAPAAPTVSSVTVSPLSVTVKKGETQQFTVTVTGENEPAQTVTWTVEGGQADGTTIADGLLTVAADETADALTVRATSDVDDSKSGTAAVTVTDEEVTRYTLTVNGGSGSGEYAANDRITINADTAEPGKQFKEWTAEGLTLPDPTENPLTITMPAGNAELTAVYEEIPAAVDKTALDAAITAANAAKSGVATGESADQVASGTKFVTADEMKALNDAVAAALAVQNSMDAAQDAVDDAVAALNDAVDAFKAAVKTGTKSTGGSSGGSHSSNTTTSTTTTPDGGKITTTVNKTTGETTVTTTSPDGGKSVVKTDKDGGQTATVTLPDGGTGAVTKPPMPEMRPGASADKAPSITVETQRPVAVVIPVKDGGSTVVAVIENRDGTQTIVTKSVMGKDGLIVPLSGTTTFKLVDNSKTFVDVPRESWAKSAVDYVTSRELFQGTSAHTFSPNQEMNRAMLVTVLWRLEGKPDGNGEGFTDVSETAYYAEAVKWASGNGIVAGTGSGFAPNDPITREQLVAILYRYAGSPAIGSDLPYRFTDRGEVSDWAIDAMTWAIQNNIITGKTADTIAPKDSATRAEVAVMLQRFVSMA